MWYERSKIINYLHILERKLIQVYRECINHEQSKSIINSHLNIKSNVLYTSLAFSLGLFMSYKHNDDYFSLSNYFWDCIVQCNFDHFQQIHSWVTNTKVVILALPFMNVIYFVGNFSWGILLSTVGALFEDTFYNL